MGGSEANVQVANLEERRHEANLIGPGCLVGEIYFRPPAMRVNPVSYGVDCGVFAANRIACGHPPEATQDKNRTSLSQ